MEWWLQLTVAVLGSGALSTGLTLYFTRGKTDAEATSIYAAAHKTDADANRTEAEAMRVYMDEVRAGLERWKAATLDWSECVKEKSAAETRASEADARWREEATERERIEKYAEGLRLQKVAADAEITRLNGELAEARKR